MFGLVGAIYKEAGKQELYLKQRPEELGKLWLKCGLVVIPRNYGMNQEKLMEKYLKKFREYAIII